MENIFNLLDFETQNVIVNCTNNVITDCANNVNDNEISDFLQLSCEDPNLMDFMVGGNDEALYTVTSDKTKENKKFKCDERIIQLKSTDHKKKSFQEAVEFCHNYIDSIYSNYIAPLDDNTRIRTVIQHDEFNSAINFPFMKKKDLTFD